MNRRIASRMLVGTAVAAAWPATRDPLAADAWPTCPITCVVPCTPVGSTDVIARTVGQ